MNMKKILVLGIVLAAIISIGAVSAWEMSWESSSSSSVGTDGSSSSSGSVAINNNELKIDDHDFTIPDGYKENESARKVDADSDLDDGCKMTLCEFNKDDKFVIVKVIHSTSGDIDEDTYTPSQGASAKKIGDTDGFLSEKDGILTFDYTDDGSLIEIVAPDEATIASMIK